MLGNGVFISDLRFHRDTGFGHKSADLIDQGRAGFGVKGHGFLLPFFSSAHTLSANAALVEGAHEGKVPQSKQRGVPCPQR